VSSSPEACARMAGPDPSLQQLAHRSPGSAPRHSRPPDGPHAPARAQAKLLGLADKGGGTLQAPGAGAR